MNQLKAHGFSGAELDRGWKLLRAAADLRFANAELAEERVGDLSAVAAWASKWMTLAEVTARHHAPKLTPRLTSGLDRSEPKRALLAASIFLDRLDELTNDRSTTAKALLALLVERGLTEETRQQGRSLIAPLITVVEPVTIPDPGLPERQARAFAELAAFYREWSSISRAVIRDRRQLAALGFGKVGRPKGSKSRTTSRSSSVDGSPNDA
jgi:hypothetical protein